VHQGERRPGQHPVQCDFHTAHHDGPGDSTAQVRGCEQPLLRQVELGTGSRVFELFS
jgi:hypothetical protein